MQTCDILTSLTLLRGYKHISFHELSLLFSLLQKTNEVRLKRTRIRIHYLINSLNIMLTAWSAPPPIIKARLYVLHVCAQR